MNARFYDPTLNRFVTADSIIPEPGYSQAYNRYAYVYNSPLNMVDPTGHLPTIDPGDTDNPPGIPSCNGEPCQYAYSDQYGWIDIKHMYAGVGKMQYVLEQLESGNHSITLNGGVGGGVPPSVALFEVVYSISDEITPDLYESVALGILMDYELQFEAWQGAVLFGNSSYAIEDLPSDYLGFYSGITNQDPVTTLQQLGQLEWSNSGPPLPSLAASTQIMASPAGFITINQTLRFQEDMNMQFMPLVADVTGAQSHVPWPEHMQLEALGSSSGYWSVASTRSGGLWGGLFD